MDAFFALQVSVRELARDRHGHRLDAGLVSKLHVVHEISEAVLVNPVNIHPLEHRAPVAGLCSSGAGADCDDGVVRVHLSGEEADQFKPVQGGVELPDQSVRLFVELGCTPLLGGEFSQGGQVLRLGDNALEGLDGVLEAAYLVHDRLGFLAGVPEVGACHGGLKQIQPFTLGGDVKDTP